MCWCWKIFMYYRLREIFIYYCKLAWTGNKWLVVYSTPSILKTLFLQVNTVILPWLQTNKIWPFCLSGAAIWFLWGPEDYPRSKPFFFFTIFTWWTIFLVQWKPTLFSLHKNQWKSIKQVYFFLNKSEANHFLCKLKTNLFSSVSPYKNQIGVP